ncbi:hypothetical protein FB382_003058 [Nocardioides ginsengisegetis]|uniref:Uncharacterized protein n=1 Tax=Nocardioides ginsengisegetis TaxID=661491 RepID=A0A7W3J1W0_9ACTN|nr:hypothetical protein [Nocardioides ginsengisegetis]MBA8804767.1 hypothetical protein [Nocardioides ginsengisegetis]
MRRSTTARAAALVLAASLAGCGGSSPDTTSPPATSSTSGSATATTSSSPSPVGTVADLPHPGLMLIVCTGGTSGTMQLLDLDPASGEVVGEVDLTSYVETGPWSSASLVTACDPARPSWRAREAFDPTFGRIAISLPFPDDGTYRVGWYDVASGDVTDVTGGDVDSGFSGGTLRDMEPVFDPVSGDLWFERGDKTISVDPSTMAETDRGPFTVATNTDSQLGVANGHLVTTFGFVPDAEGKRAAGIVPGNDGGAVLRVLDASQGVIDEQMSGTDIPYPGPGNECVVETWLDASTVIVGGPNGADCPFTKVDVDAAKPTPEPVLPAVTNDRLNNDFVASPGGHGFALLTSAAESFTVYESDGSASTEPKELWQAPATGLVQAVLLCWC